RPGKPSSRIDRLIEGRNGLIFLRSAIGAWWHSHFWLCSRDPARMGDPCPRRTETARFGGTAISGCALTTHTHGRPSPKTDRNRTPWWHSHSGCALTTTHPWATLLQDWTETTTNIEKVFASATIARPSSNPLCRRETASPCSGEPARLWEGLLAPLD